MRRVVLALFLLAAAAIPARGADPAKVLRVAFPTDITGLDPHATSDAYSNRINRAMFDSLLQYDFLKRPFTLQPSVAEAHAFMPHPWRYLDVDVARRAVIATPASNP